MRNEELAQVEIRALREELRGVMRRGDLSEAERTAKAVAIHQQIIFRGGEPEPGVPVQARSVKAADRRTTDAPKAARKKAAARKPAARRRKGS